MTAMWSSLRGYLVEAQPYQRFLYRIAAIFAASGVLHAVVFVADDRPWHGTASWRQPMAFSFGFSFVLSSLAWAMSFLPSRKRLGWAVLGTLGVAALLTFLLIAVQAWRGQRAFFPEDLPLDNAIWTGIQIGIGLIVLAIVMEAVWAFARLEAPQSIRWAIRAGLLLVVAGLAMGGVMVTEGVLQDLENEEPGQVDSPIVSGESGLVLVPHLIALHGLLVLSVLAWLLTFTSGPERRRTAAVQIASAGYFALVAVLLVQALGGRAPLDLSGVLAALFWVSLALVIGTGAVTMLGLGRATRKQPA